MLRSPLIRRLYDVLALVAFLNMLALTGVAGYVLSSGLMDAAKMQRVVSVLRGAEMPAALPAEVLPEKPSEKATPMPAAVEDQGSARDPEPATSQMDLEIIRREAERIKEELRQRLALNNSILLRVTTEREMFHQERAQAKKQQEARESERREGGFVKQVEIYEGLAPKLAAQHLLGISEPEEAAKVLMAIEPRKARKIVEAAKRGDQMDRMMVILQRVREVAPAKSEELNTEEP